MKQLTTGILHKSSDAVVISGLADGTILVPKEAFVTLTGYARRDLVGRPGRDLLVGLEQMADPTGIETLGAFGRSRTPDRSAACR